MSVLGRWTAHSQAQTQSIREGAGFDEDNEKKQMKLGEHYNSITAQLDVSENIRKRNHKTGDGLDSSHQPDSGTQIIVRELHGKIRELNFSLMAHSALDSFDDLSDACSPNLEHTLKGRVCWTVSEVGGVPTVPNVASSSVLIHLRNLLARFRRLTILIANKEAPSRLGPLSSRSTAAAFPRQTRRLSLESDHTSGQVSSFISIQANSLHLSNNTGSSLAVAHNITTIVHASSTASPHKLSTLVMSANLDHKY